MSRITEIAKTMKSWWNEADDPYVHRALDEIIRIDQEQLPTIEPKRGRWIDLDDQWGLRGTVKCSACGNLWGLIDGTPQDNGMNFCPNCGADMRGGKE